LTSPGVDLFGPGRAVETTLKAELSLAREKVGFENAKVPYSFPIDLATTLPHVRSLQTRALEIPAWSLAAVNDVRGYAVNACAKQRGVALSKVLAGLDARNNMSAKTIGLIRQDPHDLDSALDPTEPLMEAFRAVFAVATPWPRRPAAGTFSANEARIRVLVDLVDAPTQRALSRVVLGMARAEQWRLAAVKSWYPNGIDHADLAKVISERNPFAVPIPRARTFDYNAMARAGITLAQAVGQLAAHLKAHPLPETLNFRLATPLGEVVLNGRPADDAYSLVAPALVVDQRGSDTYAGVIAAPALESIPLSVVIDLSGNDKYLAKDTSGTQGAGLFSFGFLIDLEGDDEYVARDYAQGASAFGVGALWDGGGADRYTARFYAQGSGVFGAGVAVDLAGDDEYRLVSFGQGFAFVRSSGLLLDVSGNDLFDADDTNIINPSAQTKEHNTSMAQGAAFGVRGNDYPESMAGGTGFLVDLGGNDRYGCGLFCQGSGYWFGHGILYDREGDDAYKGIWYVQGGSAHFALGTLIDEAGKDDYVATMNMSQGAGHDGSVGVFIEGGGDDAYGLTALSHGAGNDVGIGFFVEVSGKDVYGTAAGSQDRWYGQTASGNFANSAREGLLSLGFFFELAGVDEYKIAPAEVKNGATWKRKPQGWGPPEHLGLGKDLE
jgi:hypothetical protein